mgnify:CR=1 FL=1
MIFSDINTFDSDEDAFFRFGASVIKTLGQEKKQIERADMVSVQKEEYEDLDNVSFAVFDTETTGGSFSDVIIQMGVVCYDDQENICFKYNKYWKPPLNITIKPGAMRVHKITPCVLEKNGVDAKSEIIFIYNLFKNLKSKNKKMVAHNVSFDFRMLSQTANINGCEWDFEESDFFCTQKNSRQYVKALDKNGKVKAPTNSELYHYIYGKEPIGNLHDALVDCKVTGAGYLGGIEKKWWN